MQLLSNSAEIETHLRRLIKSSEQVSFAVAWASRNTKCCDLLLKHQGKIKLAVVGTHFYQTDPEFIADFRQHPNLRFQLTTSGVFHPKTYLFESGSEWHAIVGSANFTQGGLRGNTENAVLVSHGDIGAVAFKEELLAFLQGQFNGAHQFSEDKLAAYRQVWGNQQRRLSRLSGDYASKPGDKPRKRALLEVPQIALSWEAFFDQVKNDTHFKVADRVRVLQAARDAFATGLPFKDMDDWNRQLIAGIAPEKDFDWRLFGSMGGYGLFASAVNSRDPHLSSALDAIPFDGDVTKKHYETYLRDFRKSLDVASGTGAVTRLLAMKRPDVFICLDGENSKKLRNSFGIRPQVTPDNYWDQVVVTIQDAAWWLAERPAEDPIAQAVWDGRSAFLDVLFYAPEKPVADLK